MGVSSARYRRGLLVAALAFANLRATDPPPALVELRSRLGSWRGVGDIIVGMHRQGYDVELRQYPDAWRVNFYPTGVGALNHRGLRVGPGAEQRGEIIPSEVFL
jgi:hypothetical protein